MADAFPTFTVEIWDLFSPRKEPSQLVYSLESRAPLTVEMVQGPLMLYQIVEGNDLVKSAETSLSGNEKLVDRTRVRTRRALRESSPGRGSCEASEASE